MTLDRQKVIALKQPDRKRGRPRKLQSTTSTSRQTLAKVKLKLKLTPGVYDDALLPGSAYQFPLSAPPSDDTPEKENVEDSVLLGFKGKGIRCDGRQRIEVHALDMVCESGVDKLMSSATKGKTGEGGDIHMVSSPRMYFI